MASKCIATFSFYRHQFKKDTRKQLQSKSQLILLLAKVSEMLHDFFCNSISFYTSFEIVLVVKFVKKCWFDQKTSTIKKSNVTKMKLLVHWISLTWSIKEGENIRRLNFLSCSHKSLLKVSTFLLHNSKTRAMSFLVIWLWLVIGPVSMSISRLYKSSCKEELSTLYFLIVCLRL